ncbi:MAG: xylulokinase [Synergistaceae bacterium]|jgi:xylulokinase|nr:xylulokinase [Synergistaceae bacterium]
MSSEGYLLGIDIGTSSAKAVLADALGRVAGSGQCGYPIDSPAVGYAQQSPEEWWNAAVRAVREGMSAARKNSRHEIPVAAVSFSGQMHGFAALGSDGAPLRPAIIWADQRGFGEIAAVNEAIAKVGLDRTCNRVSAGFALPSLLWMKKHEGTVMERVRAVLQPKDYICFRMTGRKVSEPTDAAGTCAYDVKNGGWNDELIDALELPREIFPEIVPTGSIVGCVSRAVSEELGLAPGTPVVAGAADQPAGALGNGVCEFGTLSSTIGTAGQIFAPVTDPVYDEFSRTNTFNHAAPNLWYILGANLSAGYCLEWFRKNAGVTEDYRALGDRAARVPAGSRGVIFLPYLFGDRTPHLDASARAMFFGLTGGTGTDEMIRAIMEGVVFSMAESLEAAKRLGVRPKLVTASGGGAKSRLWRQIQADIYGIPVTRSIISEQACVGAAILAACGIGLYTGVSSACKAMTRVADETETPNMEANAVYMELFKIYKELYGRNRELFPKLADFT